MQKNYLSTSQLIPVAKLVTSIKTGLIRNHNRSTCGFMKLSPYYHRYLLEI